MTNESEKGNSYFLAENDFEGTFSNSECSCELQVKDTVVINTCTFESTIDILLENGVTDSNERIDHLGSTFEAE